MHHIVPSAPRNETPIHGIKLTEAWSDLQWLSAHFHPYNSHQNDHVREWLLKRIRTILHENNVPFDHVKGVQAVALDVTRTLPQSVVLYDDLVSNATFSATNTGSTSVYFEGSNIIVTIKGTTDPRLLSGEPCVLVNAHFDSVSTGFGATDDGVGVVSLLQLIKHYTTPGYYPRHCFVALLNNGEEDYLNGARVFAQHPISSQISAFLNLEGAGAGGRATVFRATDSELMKAYSASPFPFGTAVSSDGFRQGLVRSQTDYIVFNENLGKRGLDLAFYGPRSRYHTAADTSRETSIKSLWHMLSAALATTDSMLSHGDAYAHQVDTDSEPVYFDLFGRALGLLSLNALIDISISLSVLGPLLLIIACFLLVQRDRCYIFAGKSYSDSLDPHTPNDPIAIDIQGRRGIFRTLITIILATVVVIGLALLVSKTSPFIVYSSPYAVWSVLLSVFILVSWFGLSAADRTRPTVFQRLYATAWLYILSWAFVVFLTVFEVRFRITGSYVGVFLNASALVSLLVGLFELFALPRKSDYLRHAVSTSHSESGGHTPVAPSSRPRSRRDSQPLDDNVVDEESPLLGRSSRSQSRLHIGHRSQAPLSHLIHYSSVESTHAPTSEQLWASRLPSSLWALQILILAPINIILVAQIGLFLTSALSQTLADGGSAFTMYLSMSALSILLLLPIMPFIHRVSSRVALFLLATFIGSLIYDLTAFPFSRENRLKVFFQQRLDLDDDGISGNRVTLTGVDGYLQQLIGDIPSAVGQALECTDAGHGAISRLTTCSWLSNLTPDVAQGFKWPLDGKESEEGGTSNLLGLNVTRTTERTATIRLSGSNTRACKLVFDQPISDYNITGSSEQDERFVKVPDGGIKDLRLWHREWGAEWEVKLRLRPAPEDTAAEKAVTGKAVCLWSDANDPSTIPALTEIKHNMPLWSVVTKLSDGLVEGSRDFVI